MKSPILFAILACFSISVAQANELQDLTRAIEEARAASVLVEEGVENPSVLLTAGDVTEPGMIEVVYGGAGGVYTLALGGEGQIGLRFFDAAEIGSFAGVAGSFTIGVFAGAYAQVSPVPYRAAKRVYLYGRYYLAHVFSPEGGDGLNLELAEGGLGYRHPVKDPAAGDPKAWRLEIGWARSLGEDGFGLPMLRFGGSY